jgi:hypothetical protein
VFSANSLAEHFALDRVPPPVAPAGTPLEYIPGANSATGNLPIGPGFRVPMTIISRWTRGGGRLRLVAAVHRAPGERSDQHHRVIPSANDQDR